MRIIIPRLFRFLALLGKSFACLLLFAAPVSAAEPGLVGIIIDRLGSDDTAKAAIDLPANVTLAFRPDAPNVSTYARIAQRHGHEVVVHIPMGHEAHSLRPGMDDIQLQAILTWIFDRYAGYAGASGGQGAFAGDMEGMARLMTFLTDEQNSLFFVDTGSDDEESRVAQTASYAGVPLMRPDVVLGEDAGSVADGMAAALALAVNKGCAIVLSPPAPEAVAGIKSWLEASGTLADVTVSPLAGMAFDARCATDAFSSPAPEETVKVRPPRL